MPLLILENFYVAILSSIPRNGCIKRSLCGAMAVSNLAQIKGKRPMYSQNHKNKKVILLFQSLILRITRAKNKSFRYFAV
jgi:hypothetical protein